MARSWEEIRAERVARAPDLARCLAEKTRVLDTAGRLFEQLKQPGGWDSVAIALALSLDEL